LKIVRKTSDVLKTSDVYKAEEGFFYMFKPESFSYHNLISSRYNQITGLQRPDYVQNTFS